MKKFFSTIVLILSVWISYGQDFLMSNDYIFGSGSNINEEKADSLALLSFSKCVHVTVENNSTYEYDEDNFGNNESFQNYVNIRTYVNVRGLKKFVDFDNGVFTVYYYLNKKRYIEDHLNKYQENMALGEKCRELDTPHYKNLMLGHYYLAYQAVSDELLGCIYPNAILLKENAFNEVVELYNHMGYLLSARNYGESNPSGIMLVRDENVKTLPGFEYLRGNSWDIPRAFLDGDWNECEVDEAKWAYVYTTNREYRFIFEILTEYGNVKINVPDEFYANLKKKRFF